MALRVNILGKVASLCFLAFFGNVKVHVSLPCVGHIFFNFFPLVGEIYFQGIVWIFVYRSSPGNSVAATSKLSQLALNHFKHQITCLFILCMFSY